MKSKLTKKQEIKMKKTIGNQRIEVTIRHDDRYGNGHNTFSIVGDLYEGRASQPSQCGQIQNEIKKFFPELEPYFKWHLWTTDTPMHYIANTTYCAGDRDCWGLRKGEKRQIKDCNGLPMWQLMAIDTAGNEVEVYNLKKLVKSETQPNCEYTLKYLPRWRVGEGKEPNLETARKCAIWPEATLEQLRDPEQLKARIPRIVKEFKSAVESLGMVY